MKSYYVDVEGCSLIEGEVYLNGNVSWGVGSDNIEVYPDTCDDFSEFTHQWVWKEDTLEYDFPKIDRPAECPVERPFYPGSISIIKEEVKEKKEEEDNMEKLYEVFVVTKDRKIILDGKRVVAEDEDDAKFEADVSGVLRENDLTPKQVTVVCKVIDKVKVEEEPEKVKIVED